MKGTICSAFLLCTFISQAQTIDNSEGQAFVGADYFRAEFIRENSIESITEIYLIKKDGMPMGTNKGKVRYTFEKNGRLASRLEIKQIFSQNDTTQRSYEYIDGRLHSECIKTRRDITCHEYSYSDRRVSKVCHTKKSKTQVGNHQEVNINCEEYQWTSTSDTLTQYKVLNNYGLPYSTVIQSFDTDGYLLYKKEQHLRGGWSRELRYSYNERGWMQEVTSTEKNKISESRLYSYDELGNILWMETIAGERKNKLETIYSKDGLLEAVLKTSSENSDIHIVKFKYEFW